MSENVELCSIISVYLSIRRFCSSPAILSSGRHFSVIFSVPAALDIRGPSR